MSDSYREYWKNTIKAYATGGTYYHTNFAEGAPAMHTAKEIVHEKTLPLKMQKKRAAVVNSKLSQPRGDRKILAQVLAPPLAPAAAAAPAPPPPAPSPPQPDPMPLPPGPPVAHRHSAHRHSALLHSAHRLLNPLPVQPS